MDRRETTTIQITTEMWRELNQRKQPGDTFDDVLWRLLEDEDGAEESSANSEPVTADHDRESVREPKADQADVDQRVAAAVDAVASSWADDDRLAQRKEAARRVLAYAVEADEAVGKSSEIVGETFEAVPVTGQDRETWWRKNVRPVLAEAGDYSSGEHGYVVD